MSVYHYKVAMDPHVGSHLTEIVLSDWKVLATHIGILFQGARQHSAAQLGPLLLPPTAR